MLFRENMNTVYIFILIMLRTKTMFIMFVCTTVLYKYMSLRNDVHHISGNTHVRREIYLEFYHGARRHILGGVEVQDKSCPNQITFFFCFFFYIIHRYQHENRTGILIFILSKASLLFFLLLSELR